MMTDITKFKTRHDPKKQIGFFDKTELQNLKGKLPDEVIGFLKDEGKCTYRNDFIWTVLPEDYHDMLKGWGLESRSINPDECYVFLRTSLGSLVFIHSGTYYYLSPFLGEIGFLATDFDSLMNIQLSMNLVMKGSFLMESHIGNIEHLPDLADDEIYAFKPTLSSGVSLETSILRVANMKEHIAMLSNEYSHEAEFDLGPNLN